MKIEKREIEKIAKLARLTIDEKESESYSKDLSSILEYFEKLNEVNTDKVEPTNNITGLENTMREDKVDQFKDQKLLIDEAPDEDDNLIKTKSVF